jgi:hypothetical protein
MSSKYFFLFNDFVFHHRETMTSSQAQYHSGER